MAATNTTVDAGNISADGITLTAATVDTVTFTTFTPAVEILTDGAAVLYVTVDGSTPITTAGKSNQYVLPASAASRTIRLGQNGRNPVVKLISVGTPTYSVTAVPS